MSTPDIVCVVFPLASVSGPAIIGVVVVAAGLFLSWLLRTETGGDAPEDAPPEVPADAGPGGAVPAAVEPAGQPTVTSQPSE